MPPSVRLPWRAAMLLVDPLSIRQSDFRCSDCFGRSRQWRLSQAHGVTMDGEQSSWRRRGIATRNNSRSFMIRRELCAVRLLTKHRFQGHRRNLAFGPDAVTEWRHFGQPDDQRDIDTGWLKHEIADHDWRCHCPSRNATAELEMLGSSGPSLGIRWD